jgi:hypothetical protein
MQDLSYRERVFGEKIYWYVVLGQTNYYFVYAIYNTNIRILYILQTKFVHVHIYILNLCPFKNLSSPYANHLQFNTQAETEINFFLC